MKTRLQFQDTVGTSVETTTGQTWDFESAAALPLRLVGGGLLRYQPGDNAAIRSRARGEVRTFADEGRNLTAIVALLVALAVTTIGIATGIVTVVLAVLVPHRSEPREQRSEVVRRH